MVSSNLFLNRNSWKKHFSTHFLPLAPRKTGRCRATCVPMWVSLITFIQNGDCSALGCGEVLAVLLWFGETPDEILVLLHESAGLSAMSLGGGSPRVESTLLPALLYKTRWRKLSCSWTRPLGPVCHPVTYLLGHLWAIAEACLLESNPAALDTEETPPVQCQELIPEGKRRNWGCWGKGHCLPKRKWTILEK